MHICLYSLPFLISYQILLERDLLERKLRNRIDIKEGAFNMDITQFTEDPRVVQPVKQLQDYWKRQEKKISDIIDDEGNQYVDLVMEGGGVLGIALVGYTYVLESVGIRFLGVGGSSAGAINAMLIASADIPEKPKSKMILDILARLHMFSFVDGDQDAQDFIRSMIHGAGLVKMSWKGMQIIDNLLEDLGLNPGKAFEDWMTSTLKKMGIMTLADLEKRMQVLPSGLRSRQGKILTEREAGSKLALVAADISTETKVIFPEMADIYFKKLKAIDPARFVRASMSIPGFFHPYRVKDIPQGSEAVGKWKDKAGYIGQIPREVLFVDGGIMSNFPIDLFHAKGIPLAPTFGVKLGTERTEPHKIEKPTQFMTAVFDSARHCADYDFILRNPDYRNLLAFINTGDHNWLNFFMDDTAKVDLFARGVNTAVGFLMEFNWDSYKKIRSNI